MKIKIDNPNEAINDLVFIFPKAILVKMKGEIKKNNNTIHMNPILIPSK